MWNIKNYKKSSQLKSFITTLNNGMRLLKFLSTLYSSVKHDAILEGLHSVLYTINVCTQCLLIKIHLPPTLLCEVVTSHAATADNSR